LDIILHLLDWLTTADGRTGGMSAHSASVRERLPLLDDVRGEFRRVAAADVPHRVDHASRDGQGVPALNVFGGWPSI
jgi:hypothetical protein